MRSPLPPPPSAVVPTQQGSLAFMLRQWPAGQRPGEIWRGAAFALLRLNPKECEGLALLFEEESTSDETRGLVLDVLAGAGTFEAQVVIRRLLAQAVARRSNRTFAGFVQRLGFVECPDGPTLRFLMSVYAESRGEPHDVRAACAYALGAAAGQAFAAGDQEAAVRASDVIRRDLLSASNVIEKCALLTALGNVGVPTDVVLVTRFSSDAETPVRAAAALALRKMNVPEATAQLVGLLADRDVKVAQSALLALVDQKLDDAQLERLAELVLAGHTSIVVDARILRLLVAQRPKIGASGGRPSVENALRLLLGRVDGGESVGSGSGERRMAVQPPRIQASSSVRPMPAARPYVSATKASEPPAPPPRIARRVAPPPPPVPTTTAHMHVDVDQDLATNETVLPAPPPKRSAPRQHPAAATQLGLPMSLPLTVSSPPSTTPYAASAMSAAATIVDQVPLGHHGSGAYRMVQPGDNIDMVRARMAEMGLDPNARLSVIPEPPPRRQNSR